jgi:hypothetical protein
MDESFGCQCKYIGTTTRIPEAGGTADACRSVMRRFLDPHRISPPPTAAAIDPALRETDERELRRRAPTAEEEELYSAVSVPAAEQTHEQRTARSRDVGELYGVHITAAAEPAEPVGPDGGSYAGAERGEHWFDALEEDAIEGGPMPEVPLDMRDESDPGSPPADRQRDRGDVPIADAGSGGRAGL